MPKIDSQNLLWFVYGLSFGVIVTRSDFAFPWSPITLGSFAIGGAVGLAAFLAIMRMASRRS